MMLAATFHFARRATRGHSLRVGLAMLALLIFAALFGPTLAAHDPLAVDLGQSLQAPGAGSLLGTDELGRDVLARVLAGLRTDLVVVAICVALPFVIGTAVGLVSGYFGGWVDRVIMRLVDILWAFPFYVLVISIVGALGPGTGNMYLAFSLVVWISFARIVRGEVLLVRRLEYTQAVRVLGYSNARIMLRHVLPNVITPAIVFMMSDVVLTILAVTSLGFLGLGIQPPTPELGIMISEGRTFIQDGWWISVFPGLAIVYIGMTFTLIGDGLDDLLRPKR
ncbi:Peptide/nickel transport system permease protein [Paraburkholderia unamae]|uniref:ABC transporter permease n=1 Tax=Paraburkholderia unamae TaxID=219649 RepID=UPI000DC5E8AD|nr:ABC transporter permease [Paraburkholderia unamae]RAR57194.1 peptide/nickel transport system permease protein [Paraburkholderia unamae]CAG9243357.1 Peptide/nickel transport system permease protein [Paraburkholderia unamae]